VAALCGELLLCEVGPSVRDHLRQRFAAIPNIKVLSPEDVERLPDAALDLIVANSIAQYLSSDELDRLLTLWRRLLAPGGTLVIADVIPPDTSLVTDTIALVRYAARNRSLMEALFGMARTWFSPYRKMRSTLGLSRYGEAEFLGRLRAKGFAAERLSSNLEHNRSRMTFRARPR
jgi:SAM-dependent methyltransferase